MYIKACVLNYDLQVGLCSPQVRPCSPAHPNSDAFSARLVFPLTTVANKFLPFLNSNCFCWQKNSFMTAARMSKNVTSSRKPQKLDQASKFLSFRLWQIKWNFRHQRPHSGRFVKIMPVQIRTWKTFNKIKRAGNITNILKFDTRVSLISPKCRFRRN